MQETHESVKDRLWVGLHALPQMAVAYDELNAPQRCDLATLRRRGGEQPIRVAILQVPVDLRFHLAVRQALADLTEHPYDLDNALRI